MDEPVLLRTILLEKVPYGRQEANSSEGFPHSFIAENKGFWACFSAEHTHSGRHKASLFHSSMNGFYGLSFLPPSQMLTELRGTHSSRIDHHLLPLRLPQRINPRKTR